MINKDPNHLHTYDAKGKIICCTLEEKIYTKAGAEELLEEGHRHDDEHNHDDKEDN
jgi:Cd2+/Zn2+-exporting ATPase